MSAPSQPRPLDVDTALEYVVHEADFRITTPELHPNFRKDFRSAASRWRYARTGRRLLEDSTAPILSELYPDLPGALKETIAISLLRDVILSGLLKKSIIHEVSFDIPVKTSREQAVQHETHPTWFEPWWRRILNVLTEHALKTYDMKHAAVTDSVGTSHEPVQHQLSSNKRKLSAVFIAPDNNKTKEDTEALGKVVLPQKTSHLFRFDLDVVDVLVEDVFIRTGFKLCLPLINSKAAREVLFGANMGLFAHEGGALIHAALMSEICDKCAEMHPELAKRLYFSMRRPKVLATLLMKSGGSRIPAVLSLRTDEERAEYLDRYISAWTRSLSPKPISQMHVRDLVGSWVQVCIDAVKVEFPIWRLDSSTSTKIPQNSGDLPGDCAPRKRRALSSSELSKPDISTSSSIFPLPKATSTRSQIEIQSSSTIPVAMPVQDRTAGRTSAPSSPVGQSLVSGLSPTHTGGSSNLAVTHRSVSVPLRTSHCKIHSSQRTQDPSNVAGGSIPLGFILHLMSSTTAAPRSDVHLSLISTSTAGSTQDKVQDKKGPQDFVPPSEDQAPVTTTSSNFVEPGLVIFRR